MCRKTRSLSAFHGNTPDGLTGASECSKGRGISCQTSVRGNAAKPFVGPLRKKTTGLTQACNYHQRPLFSTRPYASPPQKPAFTELFRTFAYRAFVWHATVGRRPKSNKNGNGRRMRHLFPTTYPTKYIYLCLKTIA